MTVHLYLGQLSLNVQVHSEAFLTYIAFEGFILVGENFLLF